MITYRHIIHRYTPASPRVSHHVGLHDDEGRCHCPKRCSTAVRPKIPHSNCCKIVPNRPLRGRRGRFGTLLQLLECGIFGRTAVDGCLGQVQGQRWCSTWHQGANRRQSVRRVGEEGGRTATGSQGVALRAIEKTEHDRGRGRSVVQGSAGTGRPDRPRPGWAADPQSHVWLALGRGPPTSLKTGYWPPNTLDELVRPREPIGQP